MFKVWRIVKSLKEYEATLVGDWYRKSLNQRVEMKLSTVTDLKMTFVINLLATNNFQCDILVLE